MQTGWGCRGGGKKVGRRCGFENPKNATYNHEYNYSTAIWVPPGALPKTEALQMQRVACAL